MNVAILCLSMCCITQLKPNSSDLLRLDVCESEISKFKETLKDLTAKNVEFVALSSGLFVAISSLSWSLSIHPHSCCAVSRGIISFCYSCLFVCWFFVFARRFAIARISQQSQKARKCWKIWQKFPFNSTLLSLLSNPLTAFGYHPNPQLLLSFVHPIVRYSSQKQLNKFSGWRKFVCARTLFFNISRSEMCV